MTILNFDFLFDIDNSLTLFIHHLPHSDFLNGVFQFFSFKGPFALLWPLILAPFLFHIHRQRTLIYSSFLAMVVAAVIFSEDVLKNIFNRPRPLFSSISDQITLIGEYPGTFSFPSTHAGLAFCVAVFLAHFNRRWQYLIYTLAFLVAFSRVYLGYHYLLDVVAGGIMGAYIAHFVIKHDEYIERAIKKPTRRYSKA